MKHPPPINRTQPVGFAIKHRPRPGINFKRHKAFPLSIPRLFKHFIQTECDELVDPIPARHPNIAQGLIVASGKINASDPVIGKIKHRLKETAIKVGRQAVRLAVFHKKAVAFERVKLALKT